MDHLVSEATPDYHVLRTYLRYRVGDVAVRDFRGVRAAGSSPHRDPYKPGSCGAQGARLADDPLAREVVLVRGGYTAAGLHLRDHLSPGVRGETDQSPGWADGRGAGMARLRPPWAAGRRLLAASCHRGPSSTHNRLASSAVLHGGRLTDVHRHHQHPDDHWGDVLVRMALQPYRRQRAPSHRGALRRREH